MADDEVPEEPEAEGLGDFERWQRENARRSAAMVESMRTSAKMSRHPSESRTLPPALCTDPTTDHTALGS